jgi:hypothetical protein
MVHAIANFIHDRNKALLKDFQRPSNLIPNQGEKDVDKTRQTIDTICDYLELWLIIKINLYKLL